MRFYRFTISYTSSLYFFSNNASKKKKYFYPSITSGQITKAATTVQQPEAAAFPTSSKSSRNKFHKGDIKKSLYRGNRQGQTVDKGAPRQFFKDYAGAFTYRGSRFKVKRKLHFKKTQKLRGLRIKLRVSFIRTHTGIFKRRSRLGFLKSNILRSPTRPIFFSRHVRKFRKFVFRARKAAEAKPQRVAQKWHVKKKLRRRHSNVFTQVRARYNYFFTYFKLKSCRFGRRLGYKVGSSGLRKNFFATSAYKHRLVNYALTAPRLRQSFKYPYPLPLVTRFRYLGIMGRAFKRRANAILLKSKNFFRRKGKRRRRSTSKYLALNRYDAHRRYLRTLRRRGYRRNFIVYPPVGSVGRMARFSKRRYGSLLNFFVRRFRFKKLRRYIRLRRRKRRIVPILPVRRRHRRLYQALPLMFKKRSFSYVFIKQTTNNVFYSVFSRKRRLLANFSNGRTEFLGSKRISTVASEAAAKVLLSYFAANRIRSVFFIFGSRFNHFMRAAVKVFRTRRIKIAGFKYRMRRPHSLGLRKRASRRV